MRRCRGHPFAGGSAVLGNRKAGEEERLPIPCPPAKLPPDFVRTMHTENPNMEELRKICGLLLQPLLFLVRKRYYHRITHAIAAGVYYCVDLSESFQVCAVT